MAGNTEHIVDVDALVKRVREVQDKGPGNGGPPTIYRVPETIRSGDKNAYSPRILSIGPYHRSEQELKVMQEHKLKYLYELLGFDLEDNIAKCVKALKEVEEKARSCYSETISLCSKEFVEMMLLDGCFIIEFFIRRHANEEERSRKERMKAVGDPIHGVSWISPLLRHDLLLLENQIPFLVLQALFDVAVKPHGCAPHLMTLALNYLTHRTKGISPSMYDMQPHHLLHLYHLFHSCRLLHPEPALAKSGWQMPRLTFRIRARDHQSAPTRDAHMTEERTPQTIPCAAELREAGVKFRWKDSLSFLDVTFSNNVLEIPRLTVGNSTNPTFRNLIAFEQCCPTAGSYFTSYAVLMDDLINTSRDVEILHGRGIIENKLGSDEEVARLFNRLLMEVTFPSENNHFAELFQKVNSHCRYKWNKWRAKLVREYFSNPWSIISLLAAVVLLVLTIVQTVYSIIGYNHSSSRFS